MCVHSFSRVWRNKGRSGSPRSFARHSEKAGSQPKKSRYCAPPYRRLPVFGQSLLNSRRSPPSGTTPSLRRLRRRDTNGRGERERSRKGVSYERYYLSRGLAPRAAPKKNGSSVMDVSIRSDDSAGLVNASDPRDLNRSQHDVSYVKTEKENY